MARRKKPIHCPTGGSARYCRGRIRSPKGFSPASLRTIKAKGGVKLVVGCPRGKFRRGRCVVGTKLQTILYPKSSARCRKACG
jgi:hypothetical protein